jgi:N-methylhydantoinase A
MESLAAMAGVTPDEVAEVVIYFVNNAMDGALRVISIERGVDPRDFHLIAFGGAGGVHVAELAERIGARGVLIPPDPGLLSAFGMLVAPIARDRSRTVFLPAVQGGTREVEEIFEVLAGEAVAEMLEDGIPRRRVTLSRWVDARYEDQSFELRVPAEDWAEAFHRAHEERFGYRRAEVQVVAVTLRVRAEAQGIGDPAAAARHRRKGEVSPGSDDEKRTSVRWKGRWIEARLLDRGALPVGVRIEGPTLLTEYSSTTWCPPGWWIAVRESGVLEMGRR